MRVEGRADCIFTGWGGIGSPVVAQDLTFATVVDTVFHRFRLAVEIADVSKGGTVHLRNVSFADVELARGAVVSTTLNDYSPAAYGLATYYEEDDSAYDVDVEQVPAAAAGLFGAEFRVTDAVMSDCVYLMVEPFDTVLPGCPRESVRQRARVRARVGPVAAGEVLADPPDEKVMREDPVARLAAGLLVADDPWLVGTRTVRPLPALACRSGACPPL